MHTSAHLFHPVHLPPSPHMVFTVPILVGLGFGVLTRATLLAVDSGPFPSRPHGEINFIFLGFVAAVLGALAPAALLTENYTAGVFLALGVSQFHTVRQIERDMLLALDHAALVPRGHPYVEGMAMMLETRNYLVMAVALVTTSVAVLAGPLPGAALGVLSAIGVPAMASVGVQVGSRAHVRVVPVEHRDQALRINGVSVLPDPARPEVDALDAALGLRVEPRSMGTRLTLAEPGQRQAILHNVTAHLGVRSASAPHPDDPGRIRPLLPHAALDPASGALLLLCYPQVPDHARLLRAVRQTPLLESLTHWGLRRLPPGDPGPAAGASGR